MPDPKLCPTCAAPLPADATGGACPKCLLQAGFATGGAAPPADHVPSPEELAPKFPGLVIGSVLGRGGMGVVYKARHKALDRDVALKVLPASLAGDAAFAERFQREARALAKLQHPNIVAVHDFGATDGLFWLVMEFVDGANIRQAMKAGTIGPKEALAIVPQICDALQYAHEHGVVHRDIKPENVMLDRSGRVKVADFGLAKMMSHGDSDRTLTGAGQVMGTPHYMAPEQWEHPKDVDHRADIYSLGVVFYEMLTGELPIGRFAAPSGKCDVDARIDEIVLRTLEKEREARYQHASQVKTDVGALSSPAAAACAASPNLTAAEIAHRKRMSWVIVAGSLVSAVLVFVVTSRDVSPVARDVAGWMSIPVGVTLLAAVWSQRRGRRAAVDAARRRMPGWAIALIVVGSLVFCGGPIALLAAYVVSGVERPRLADLEAANQQKQKDQEAMVRGSPPAAHRSELSAEDLRGIEVKWKRLQELGLDGDLERILRIYADEDRVPLMSMPADERKNRGSGAELGLPLLASERLENPLTAFRITTARVRAADANVADVTATDGFVTVKFRMRRAREGGVWDFTVGPVEVK